MTDYFINHWIEICGVIISLGYLCFSILRLIWLWPFGLASSIFYMVIYFQSGFYADMGLQFYYAGISIYGWIVWRERHEDVESEEDGVNAVNNLQMSHLTARLAWILTGVFLVLWALIWYILGRWTDSVIPGWDALTTAASIVATWMLARKILEHWLVWVVVDAISIGLYLWKELYPTAILFLFYTSLAVVGYHQWKKAMRS